MKKTLRKPLLLALAALLLLGLLPAPALAADGGAARPGEARSCSTGEMPMERHGSSFLTDAYLRGDLEQLRAFAPDAAPAELPARYDSRDSRWITPVRNQNPYGTCWSFASIGAIEAYMVKHGMGSVNGTNLSESHLAWFSYTDAYDKLGLLSGDSSAPGYSSFLDQGGNSAIATYTLMRWEGPASESVSALKYENIGENGLSSGFAYSYDSVHVTDAEWIPTANRSAVKQAIMDYGAGYISFYWDDNYMNYDNWAYCLNYGTVSGEPAGHEPNGDGSGHAVTVVGWDDKFSRYNFNADGGPAGDGAWIVKNSWGSEWGLGGYFYLSYYDSDSNYSDCVFFKVADADNYANCYQYDGTGNMVDGIHLESGSQIANIYTANSAECLKAVSVATLDEAVSYTLSIYQDPDPADPCTGTLAATQSGFFSFSGYFTVPLEEPVELRAGERFSVVFTLSVPGGADEDSFVYVPYDATGSCGWARWTHRDRGRSSVCRSVGGSWTDAPDHGDFRIKAYTDDSLHWLDVKAKLDGAYYLSLEDCGTMDVYLNGQLAADDTTRFRETLPEGTVYFITDIKPKEGRCYEGLAYGSCCGVVEDSDANLCLSFFTASDALRLSASRLELACGESRTVDCLLSVEQPERYQLLFAIKNVLGAPASCGWLPGSEGQTLALHGEAEGSCAVLVSLVDRESGETAARASVLVSVSRDKLDPGESYGFLRHPDRDRLVVNRAGEAEAGLAAADEITDARGLWQLSGVGNGYFRIVSEYDESLLTAVPADPAQPEGSLSLRAGDGAAPSQLWFFTPDEDGTLRICSLETGLMLEPDADSVLRLAAESGSAAQRFRWEDAPDYHGMPVTPAPQLELTVENAYVAIDWSETLSEPGPWSTLSYELRVSANGDPFLSAEPESPFFEDYWKVGHYAVSVTALNRFYSPQRRGARAKSSCILSIDPFRIRLDPNGGFLDTEFFDLYYGEPVGALPRPSRRGWSFLGWFTDPDGGTQLTESELVPFTVGHSQYYAHWYSVCEENGHSYRSTVVAPTCTAQGCTFYKCSVCGESYVGDYTDALGHAWDEGRVTLQPSAEQPGEIRYTCTRCGKTRTEVLPKLDWTNPFEDLAEGKYYYDAVLWAYYHQPQITGGTDETHFSPSRPCTREQVVSFLYAAFGKPEATQSTNPFTDVREGKYYYRPVLWAVEHKITGGVSETLFGVGRPCTREQVVTFLWKAAGGPEPESAESPFSDVVPGKYYCKAVLWANENGVTGGVGGGRFGVGSPCTRAQVVTFLYAAFGK